jgi:hypothetical protein
MRTRTIYLAMLAGALALLIASCSNPFQAKTTPAPSASVSGGSAKLVLTVNGLLPKGSSTASQAKSIMPDPSGQIASYSALIHNEADGTSTKNDQTVALTASITTISLTAATYDVTVNAMNASSQVIATGTSTGNVLSAGGATTATVTIAPVVAGSGTGSFDITLSFPASVGVDGVTATFNTAAVTPTLTKGSGSTNTTVEYSASSFSIGTYILSIQLTKGGTVLATYMDSVWVAANLQTKATVTLAAGVFGAAPAAPGDLELAPQLPAATAPNNTPGMLLDWSDVSNVEENYLVYRATSSSGPWTTAIATLPAGTTSYTDRGLTDGTTYYYRVIASNRFGQSDPATGSCQAYTTADSPAAAYVTAGIAALKAKNFDSAYTNFTQAAKIDPANEAALVYAALIGVTSVSVDSAVVNLMQNRIGLSSYPSTMNALFSNTWFNQAWYGTKSGMVPVTAAQLQQYNSYYIKGDFTPESTTQNTSDGWFYYYDASGNGYYAQGEFTPDAGGSFYSSFYYSSTQGYISVSPSNLSYYGISVATYYQMGTLLDTTDIQMLPTLTVPSWAASAIGTAGVSGETSSQLAAQNYGEYLALNIIDRNPNGLNSLMDGILGGVFGSRLATSIAFIDALPDDALVAVDPSLITSFGAVAPSASQTIVIDKAELEVFAAALQAIKSYVQILDSYNLNYPLSSLNLSFWNNTSTNNSGIPDWADTLLKTAPNPIGVGFMGDRSQATRDSARATMLDAIARTQKAIALLGTVTADTANTLGGGGYLFSLSSTDIANVNTVLANSQTVSVALQKAISNGTPVYLDPSAFSSGSVAQILPSADSNDSTWTFYPSVLYSTDIFNPAKFLAVNTDSQGNPIGIDVFGINPSGRTNLTSQDAALDFGYSAIQIGFNWNRISQLVVPSNNFEGWPNMDQNGYFYESIGSIGSGSSTMWLDWNSWRLIDWLRGYNN